VSVLCDFSLLFLLAVRPLITVHQQMKSLILAQDERWRRA
jgi:hypothetical protein